MRFGILFSVAALSLSCSDKSTVITTIQNNPPVADAGSDQSLSADQEIRLDGGGSFDPDGDLMSYTWSFSRVPDGSGLLSSDNPFSTNNTASSITSFEPDIMGIYIVSLVVTDAKGETSMTDSVIVSVSEGALPTADAGEDQNTTQGANVDLSGIGSFDPLNRSLFYEWSISSAPENSTASIQDATAVSTSFQPDMSGRYLISLVVNSGVSISEPDIMVVNVASSNPEPPIASASLATSAVTEDCSEIALDGSASSDPNGDSLTYFWSLQQKPADSQSEDSSFDDRYTVDPHFYADVAGEYVFSMAVSDGQEWSDADLLTIDVTDRALNSAPAVNAGMGSTLSGGNASCTYSWGWPTSGYTCGTCDEVVVSLGADASVNDPDGDTYSIEWSAISDDTHLSNTEKMETTVTLRNASPTGPNVCTDTMYEVQLSATDCPGDVSTDVISFTVVCCGVESQ